jgi:AcrR family transcriptional regulator
VDGADGADSTDGADPRPGLRAQGRETMRRLLDAGRDVFERRGFHGARVDDIVEVAGTSHGTFYLYFANKDELFRALMAEVAAALAALSVDLPDVVPTPAGRRELRAWLGRFGDLYRDNAPVIRAWTEAEVDDTAVLESGATLLERVTSWLPAPGTIDLTDGAPAPRADITALALIAMIERVNYYVHGGRIDADPDAVLDTLSSILFFGVFGAAR